MTFSAAIFDLDGTLIDSMGIWETIDEVFFSARGLAVPPQYYETVAAMSLWETAVYTAKLLGNKEKPEAYIKEWQSLALEQYRNHIPLKPFVKEYLAYLQSYHIPMAIATSSPKVLYDAVLTQHNISSFFSVVCSTEETGIGKDQPEIFMRTARILGIAPENCIVFEDLFQGVNSALQAGMIPYGVYDQYAEKQKENIKKIAAGYIMNFSEAPKPFKIK